VVDPAARLGDQIADAVSVGLFVTAGDGAVVWANAALRVLLGAWDASLAAVREELDRLPVADIGAGDTRELIWPDSDGAERWWRVSCLALPGAEDALLYEVVDVTAAHQEREVGRERQARLSRLEALARIGTWEWDLVANRVAWSAELLRAFGFPPGAQLDYGTYRALLHPDDVRLVEETLTGAVRTAQPFSYTHRMYLADGVTPRVFECVGEVVTDAAGAPVRILATAQDVTDRRRVQEELAYLAEHDSLTGLANRRAVLARLAGYLTGDGTGARPPGALLLLDVDNFKDVNDRRGHAVGDTVLRALAGLLRAQAGPDALVGRLGGDEFAVVLAAVGPDAALGVAEALCDAVAGTPIVTTGAALAVTVSVGVAPLDGAGPDVESMLADADLALYDAKGGGRNRARLFVSERPPPARRVSAQQRVRDALGSGALALDAQPIIDLTSGAVVGHELLLRLRDGAEPGLGPAEFLPSVQRTDLILQLDRWVVAQAVAALATGAARRAGLRLEVNVSGRSVEDAEFAGWVLETLRRGGVPPSRLGLEITETTAITSPDATRRMAERLTGAGCRFVLDDFGAAFGSFVHLRHAPFTAVKIAGEFTRDADVDHTDGLLVAALVRAARALDMQTTAEAVDRAPLARALRDLGVDHGQGYHLGRPRPLRDWIDSA
jgi:diguanylate cyclase (GGDEF)-like protein